MDGGQHDWSGPQIAGPQIRCTDVTFSYGRSIALAGVSLSLGRGVTGLLGPNGAGKSTLMRVLSTILPPSSGELHIDGTVVDQQSTPGLRRRIGLLPQRFDTMGSATVLRNVSYAAWAAGVAPSDAVARAQEALAVVGLEKRAEHKARELSGGQRQRLGIACAIAHQPAMLLLDEPTVGLDPLQRAGLRNHLQQIGRTSAVLVSTHLVEDLSTISDSIIVLAEGRVVFTGSVSELARLGADSPTQGLTELEAGYAAVIHR